MKELGKNKRKNSAFSHIFNQSQDEGQEWTSPSKPHSNGIILVSPSTSMGGENNTCSTSPANSDTSTPSRKYFFPLVAQVEPSTSTGNSSPIPKKTVTTRTNRKSSIVQINKASTSLDSDAGSPKRKKSIAATGAAAKKTMRKRFSQAKLALRKFSYSSQFGNNKYNSATSMSPVSLLDSPTDRRSLDSPVVSIKADISPSNSLGGNDRDENLAPVHKKGFFFPKFRKLSSTTPPPTSCLNPSIAALKKPLGPSLSWDPEQR